MDRDLDKRVRELMIALFPDERISQYQLSKLLEVSPKTPGRWYRKYVEGNLDHLFNKEEEGEKQNYTIYYSLTDEGREIAKDVTANKAARLEERTEKLWQKVIDYEDEKGEG